MTAIEKVEYGTDHYGDKHPTFYDGGPWNTKLFDPSLVDKARHADLDLDEIFDDWDSYFNTDHRMMTLRKIGANELVPDGFRVVATWPNDDKLLVMTKND